MQIMPVDLRLAVSVQIVSPLTIFVTPFTGICSLITFFHPKICLNNKTAVCFHRCEKVCVSLVCVLVAGVIPGHAFARMVWGQFNPSPNNPLGFQ